MQGVKVGHQQNNDHGTGVSVFLLENSAIGAVLICGSAPASHELAVLAPENSVPELHALVFTGGSAFGLQTAQGVMKYLVERNIGHATLAGVVPIVPTAAIYDLAYKKPIAPSAELAYEACIIATEDNMATGRIGAGTGATIGKIIPDTHWMSGGIGRAVMQVDDIEVMAYAVVNSIGDVRDHQGNIIAGACDHTGKFMNCEKYLLTSHQYIKHFSEDNSTLVAVFTNALFSKQSLSQIAKAAIAGIARAVSPVFTRFDGDMLFCVSVGTVEAEELIVGSLAAEAVRLAILSAVQHSEIIS